MTMSQLKWTRKNVLGVTTYRTESAGWKFTADRPTPSGPWEVRGWGPGGAFFYDTARTLAQVKAAAAVCLWG
jgi:hypothetical protein